VAVEVRDRLRLPRLAASVAVVAMGLVVVFQLALLAGMLSFEVQAPLVVGCQLVIFGWLLMISIAGAMPARVARFGTAVAASFLLGSAVAGLTLLALWGSPLAFVGFAVAVLIGLPGWLGFPVWSLLVARLVDDSAHG
jgi:hypothetical protein